MIQSQNESTFQVDFTKSHNEQQNVPPTQSLRDEYAHLFKQATTVDDGLYTVEIEALYPTLTEKKEKKKVVVWLLRIQGGRFASKIVAKYNNLTSDKSINKLRQELQKLGLSVNSMEELEACAKQVFGTRLKVRVVTNDNNFPEYKITRVLGYGAPTSSPPTFS